MEFIHQAILILSLIILILMSVYTFSKRKALGAGPFLVQTIVTIIWTLASLIEFSVYSLESKILWRNIQQLGIFIGPISSVFFAIEYTKQHKLKKCAYVVMTIPLTALVLIFTDNYHHIMRLSCKIVENETFGRALVVTSTAIGRTFVVFNFCIPLLTIAILLDFMLRVSKHYRKRVLLVMISIFLLLGTSLLRVTYLEKNGFFIPGAVLYTPSAIILFYSIFIYKIFSLSPVARDKVFDVINEGILVVDLDNNIIDINLSAYEILSKSLNYKKEILGEGIEEVFRAVPEIKDLVLNSKEKSKEIKLVNTEIRYVNFKIYPLLINSIEKVGSVMIINDVTEKKSYELFLKDKASRDSLTELLNRSGFANAFTSLMNKQDSSNQLVSVFMIDIDRFKSINDTFGHINGDSILKHLAKLLREELRGQDIIGRLGGEEFAVILPEVAKLEAFNIAERIRKKIENSTVLSKEGLIIKYTISIGVNDNLKSEKNLEQLLHEGDIALYEAKNKTRNCTVLYDK